MSKIAELFRELNLPDPISEHDAFLDDYLEQLERDQPTECEQKPYENLTGARWRGQQP